MLKIRMQGSLKVITVSCLILVSLIFLAAETSGNFSGDTSQSIDLSSDDSTLRMGEDRSLPDGRFSTESLGDHEEYLENDTDEGVHRWWPHPGGNECSGSDCRDHARPNELSPRARRERARTRGLGLITQGIARKHGSFRASSNAHQPSEDQARDEQEPEPEYTSIRQYLADGDETLAEVRDVNDILADPSNIVREEDHISLLAWDVREQEPRGSYLYVLQQDTENMVSQVHRYFCPERRLDVIAEVCVPIASVFSSSGAPYAVDYSQGGQPLQEQANDLDPSIFSRDTSYVEANEFLLGLQEYFDSMRS